MDASRARAGSDALDVHVRDPEVAAEVRPRPCARLARRMKIACIGGGPAALYFSLLLRQARPDVEIDVYEQNRADDTFGWGVVFSDETLGNFEAADPVSFAQIQASFRRWTDIE